MEVNSKKLNEIYKEWSGNESCYDTGRPLFDADELLDFAKFCLNKADRRNPFCQIIETATGKVIKDFGVTVHRT